MTYKEELLTAMARTRALGLAAGELKFSDIRSPLDLRESGEYHVWMTLPDLQVVDLTLLISLAVQSGEDPSKSKPLAVYPDLQVGVRWLPLYTGEAACSHLLKFGS